MSSPRRMVEAQTVTYRSSLDGSDVPALVAIPCDVASRGCVIWQGGFGSKKEDSSSAWQWLAMLGLSTFSLDLRHHGARSRGPAELERVRKSPSLYAEVIRDTVADVRDAVDYLTQQPYCGPNIASAGVSLGGAIGVISTAADERIGAAVVMSTPGTWRDVLTQPSLQRLPGSVRGREQIDAAVRILSPFDPARFIGQISPRPVLILSGLEDEIVVPATAHTLQAAARAPKTIVDYNGGHDPFAGSARASNTEAITSFLHRFLVDSGGRSVLGASGPLVSRDLAAAPTPVREDPL